MFSYQKKYFKRILNFIKNIFNNNLEEQKQVLEKKKEDEVLLEEEEKVEKEEVEKEEVKKEEEEEREEEKVEKEEKNEIFKKYTEYFFLPERQLHNVFNFDRDITKEFEIHLCIYRINTILPMPYLEYYFENSNLEYTFPSKQISPEIFKNVNEGKKLEPIDLENEKEENKVENEDEKEENKVENEDEKEIEKEDENEEDEVDEVEEIFLEQCFIFFKEKANYKGDINEFKDIYRGFLFFRDETNNTEYSNKIVVVIDSTNIDIFKIKDVKQTWAITYEILELKKIIDSNINNNVVEIFNNNKILNNIKKYVDLDDKKTKSENLVYPKILYLCKKEDQYVNVYYDEGDNSQNTKTLIYEKIKHPILKDIYLFSKDRILSDIDANQIKRFILFIYEKNMIEGEPNETNIPEEPIIGFKENEKEFWCCKTNRFFVESGEH
jgi:hypothetical protein